MEFFFGLGSSDCFTQFVSHDFNIQVFSYFAFFEFSRMSKKESMDQSSMGSSVRRKSAKFSEFAPCVFNRLFRILLAPLCFYGLL